MNEWQTELLMNSYRFDFPVHKPIQDLTASQYELLWTGNSFFKGLNEFFEELILGDREYD